MRVHANRDSALVLAAQASKAVPKITTIPELKGIHMEADARLANVIQFEAYTSTLTPLQQRIAELRDIGYSDREISAICGIPYKVVALEMEGAKRSILEVYIGDAPRAA